MLILELSLSGSLTAPGQGSLTTIGELFNISTLTQVNLAEHTRTWTKHSLALKPNPKPKPKPTNLSPTVTDQLSFLEPGYSCQIK